MQVPPIMTDFMNFKDEMFKKVRLLENKLINEMNTKYNQLNTKYEKLENKMTFISENTDTLLEFVTEQKLNAEKILELESSKNKTEQNIIMHDMKLKNILVEIDKIKSKYDKIFIENMLVPGYIGQGCQFKSISEYIQNNVLDLAKLKNEKDQIKIENVEVKNRLDNILKSTMNLFDNSIIRCQNYSDNKHEDMKNILNNKLNEIKEKNMDLRAQISKNELENEKQIQKLRKEIDNFSLIKTDLMNLTDKKIEVINNKMKEVNEEINVLVKKIKENEENLKNIKNLKTKIESYKNNENSNSIINTPKKINYKLQKMIPMEVKNNLEKSNNQINKYNNDIKNQTKGKEDKKINLSEEDIISQNFIKKFKDSDEFYSSKEEINEFIQIQQEKNEKENKTKLIKNKNINDKINDIIKMNDFSTYLKKEEININQNNINNNINKELNISINSNYKNPILKVSEYIKNRKRLSKEKIKIESLDKKNAIKSNSLQNIKVIENKKIGLKISSNSKKKKALLTGKNFTKIDINNKENKNEANKTITPRTNIILEKNKSINIKRDKNQDKIMNEIKTFYNNRIEKNEQKSQENIVDCNIINLYLEKPSYKNYLNSSSRNIHSSKEIKINNNLNEIGMKVNPAFGRTTYKFYNKKDPSGLTTFIDNNIEKNKFNSLKDKINIAFVSSINQKISLNDKSNNL